MQTLSIIKADTGGFVGHTAVHPRMVELARGRIEAVRGDLVMDGQVATCGDDLALVLSHTRGPRPNREPAGIPALTRA